MENNHVGAKIDRLRRERKETLDEFAAKLGVVKATVSKWSHQKDMNTETLRNISRVYRVPISYFFDDFTFVASNIQHVAENATAYNIQNSTSELALKDEKIKGLEREVELLKKMVAMLEKSNQN